MTMIDPVLLEREEPNAEMEQQIAQLLPNPLFRIFQTQCRMHAGFVASRPANRDDACEHLRQFAKQKLALDTELTEYMIASAMHAAQSPPAPPLQPDAAQPVPAEALVHAETLAGARQSDAAEACAQAMPPAAAPGDSEKSILPECDSLDITTLDQIAPEPVDWLWPGRIALRRMTIIAGDPGLGKSQVALSVAATVTRGGTWPCGEGQASSGEAIVLSAEDIFSETLRPRFDAANGDGSRLHVIRAVKRRGQAREFDLADDLALLERALAQRPDVRLVIIDPVTAYMKGNGSSPESVRAVLTPIGALAERARVAVLLVTHLNKTSRRAIQRITGSGSYVAVARAVFLVAANPKDKAQRLFLEVKNNLAPPGPGLAFRLMSREVARGVKSSHVVWENATVETGVDEVLKARPSSEDSAAKQEAIAFLQALLADGPKPVREIERDAVSARLLTEGVALSQASAFRAARERLGIQSRKIGAPGEAQDWLWELRDAHKVAS